MGVEKRIYVRCVDEGRSRIRLLGPPPPPSPTRPLSPPRIQNGFGYRTQKNTSILDRKKNIILFFLVKTQLRIFNATTVLREWEQLNVIRTSVKNSYVT
jgi:hypothetical protein